MGPLYGKKRRNPRGQAGGQHAVSHTHTADHEYKTRVAAVRFEIAARTSHIAQQWRTHHQNNRMITMV